MLLRDCGWTVLRLVGYDRGGEGECVSLPTVQALHGWRILVGRSKRDGMALYVDTLDETWFANVHNEDASPVHGFTYAILSKRELALFLVGPAIPSHDANLAFHWPGRDVMVLGPESSVIEVQQGSKVFVPTLDRREIPINYKGPFGCLEVQTRLWNEDRSVFMRLEQFSPDRIPLAQYTVWRESSHGAYSCYTQDPRRLERMSSAAFCWMFGLREAFEDSGYARAFQKQDPGNHVGVLGFETNNPIHDDHDGRGPHFHVGLRSSVKAKERNPAFYINPEGGRVSESVYNTTGVELTSSGLFGVLRLKGGELALGPMVRFRNARTGMYLYVRESEQGDGQGLFQTSDGEMGDNVAWILVGVSKGVYSLCNVRSSCAAHADSTKVVDSLVQSSDFGAQSSRWNLRVSIEGSTVQLRNCATNHFMYAFFAQQALPIAQYHESDNGSEWFVECKQGSAWTPVSPSRLPPTYNFSFTHLAEGRAALEIRKDGDPWANIELERSFDSDRVGTIRVGVQTQGGTRETIIKFDRITGKQLQ